MSGSSVKRETGFFENPGFSGRPKSEEILLNYVVINDALVFSATWFKLW
jgi:hypothetical protein